MLTDTTKRSTVLFYATNIRPDVVAVADSFSWAFVGHADFNLMEWEGCSMITAEELQLVLARSLDWIESPSLEACFDCLAKKRDVAGFIIHTSDCRRGRFMHEVLEAVEADILYEVSIIEPEATMGMNILAWEELEARAKKAEAGFNTLRDYLLEIRQRVSGIEATCIDLLLLKAENPEITIAKKETLDDPK